jgi:outer membrane protein assembly factor BamB
MNQSKLDSTVWIRRAAAAAMALAAATPLWGQIVIRGGIRPLPGGPPVVTTTKDGDEKEKSGASDEESLFPESAALKTDPDMDRLMRRAQDFTDNQRWEVAAALWQEVLDRSGSELTTRSEWIAKIDEHDARQWLQTYKSVRNEVETLLAKMPPEGRAEYRKISDVKAQTLIAAAQGEREEPLLAEAARKFFVSSVGDDAAYRLACLLLDRHDFLGAGRLLEKILEVHPDPSMPREELLVRLAVCYARGGDRIRGDLQMEKLKDLAAKRRISVPADFVSLVADDVAKPHGLPSQSVAGGSNWVMPLGTPARDGSMQALAAGAMDRPLSETWAYKIDAFESEEFKRQLADGRTPATTDLAMRRVAISSYSPRGGGVAPAPGRDQLVARWKTQNWFPTAQALVHDGKLIVRTYTHVVCLDTSAVGEPKLVWRAPPERAKVSLFGFGRKKTQDEDVDQLADEFKQWSGYQQMLAQFGGGGDLSDYRGTYLFGDRTLPSMCLVDGAVLFLEGSPQIRADVDPAVWANMWGGSQQNIGLKARSSLVAVDAASGKMRWVWPNAKTGEKQPDDFRIMAAPTPHRDLLIVPVQANKSLWLYGLRIEKQTAKDDKIEYVVHTAWKTSLCEDPQSGFNRWASVGVCVDGGEAFVASGRGVFFSVDADSGAIRWAIRYQRSIGQGRPSQNQFTGRMVSQRPIKGWSENYVIARGPLVLLMPSDSQQLLALSRTSGDMRWRGETDDAINYCLGTVGNLLYVAGSQMVRCYSVGGETGEGNMIWEEAVATSHGRGVLTADAVYIPVKDAIHRYALRARPEGQLTGSVTVAFTTDREDPVGNLFTDGKSFFALGPERVFALANGEMQVKLLDQQIVAGETALKSKRMLLRSRLGDLAGALDDLKAVDAAAVKAEGKLAALGTMLDAIEQLELVKSSPEAALDLLVGAPGAITRLAPEERQSLAMDDQLHTAAVLSDLVAAIRDQKAVRTTPLVLRMVAAWNDEPLRLAAAKALGEIVTSEQAPALREALRGDDAAVRVAAVTVLAKALGEDGADEIAALLEDKTQAVALAAATALAERGDRRALPALVRLLESASPPIRQGAIRVLQAATGQRLDFVAFADDAARQMAVKKWQTWLADQSPSAQLNVPLKYLSQSLGRILVTDSRSDSAPLFELDLDGKQLVTIKSVNDPYGCEGLPNGHRLVASHQGAYVVEFDAQGAELWRSKDKLDFWPTSVQRLDNGNTLVAGYQVGETERGWIVEINRDGRPIESKRIQLPYRPKEAVRLPSGRLLVTAKYANRVVELDSAGREIEATSLPDLVQPERARRLPNGHTLVADNGGNRTYNKDQGVRRRNRGTGRVLEFNDKKQIVWSALEGNGDIYDVERLDGGDTLILEIDPGGGRQTIRRIDRDGNTVWTKSFPGIGLRRITAY